MTIKPEATGTSSDALLIYWAFKYPPVETTNKEIKETKEEIGNLKENNIQVEKPEKELIEENKNEKEDMG